MNNIEKISNHLKDGSLIIIKKIKNQYQGYILKHDGNIFQDVIAINLEKLICEFPNIQKALDSGLTYHAVYDFENRKYKSSIIKRQDEKTQSKMITNEERLDGLQALCYDYLDSLIEIDIKTQKYQKKGKELQKKKIS